MKNILVAIEVNNTALMNRMLDAAAQMSKAFNSKCWLIQIAAPDPDFVGYEVGPQYIRDFKAEELREVHRAVQTQTELLKTKGVDAEGLMIQGPTEEMILEEVDKLNIELLILGNKNHGLLHSIFIGSVTDDLIQEAKIPILLIPGEED
ncbi:universal stress protein [Acidiluteibacter ferrifornacis]|uniref:Universal stress protein n=1 Tax=Acidiluteibacter ferrifornacis TaxID=2692424 RepID=A0A6N9NIS6_9FLAO|nr:universal stress protein [Acidiluteibacter ferrifornacis]NBG65749.1 universal stress protein [Acidiluteibacter ferrifornacis]